jgi:hypothetical protein
MNEPLNQKNFILYCAKNYDSNHCSSTDDFYEDLNRIRYIKKLITRYTETGELKERLILNHVMILHNVFGPTVTCRILYFKLKDQFKYVKPFLLLLNILPDYLYNINQEKVIDINCIDMDTRIVNALRAI